MILIKNQKEIEVIRQGGKILSKILKEIIKEVKPGITTGHLEEMACLLIKQAGGRPSFKNYKSKKEERPFPTALCTSVNNEVVHAPSLPSRTLKNSDIIGIDLGIEYPYNNKKSGYYTDMAVTVPVGQVSKEAEKLINTAKNSLILAINQIRPGNKLNQIGKVIQKFVEENGFSVVRQLVGHGVGLAVHEEPQIPNYDFANSEKIILKSGMILAIEPMINLGGWRVVTGTDKFTILTADGSLSAHFEETVLVTEQGHEILTLF